MSDEMNATVSDAPATETTTTATPTPATTSLAPSCRYCGIASAASVVRCVESGWWFCNSAGGTTGSHIIQHLVRTRNKQVGLHPDSALGETIVECYNCGLRNVFMLGFIPAKGETVVVLLCRSCLGIGALKELGWSLASWTPIIRERRFVPWLVGEPTRDEQQESVPITTSQIYRLEDLWKSKPNATLVDLENPDDAEDDVSHVELQYTDGKHLMNVLGPLVKLEAEYDRQMKESASMDNVSVRWTSNDRTGQTFATLRFSDSLADYSANRITVGDEICLLLPRHAAGMIAEEWTGNGTVLAVEAEGHIHVEMSAENVVEGSGGGGGDKGGRRRRGGGGGRGSGLSASAISVPLSPVVAMPVSISEGYKLSLVWKPVPFDRMIAALVALSKGADTKHVDAHMYMRLLGQTTSDEHEDQDGMPSTPNGSTYPLNADFDDTDVPVHAPNLPALNTSQSEAVRNVLKGRLSLIQGPPGTGKTVVSATLVYHMVRRAARGQRVLVVAPSNVAVDQLADRIDATGVRVVRLAARSREHLSSTVEHLCLHTLINSLESPPALEFKHLSTVYSSGTLMSAKDIRRMKKLRRQLERDALKYAQVICCTCVGAGDPRLESFKFDSVLLDEATQATEPESLIPIMRGCRNFVLVGDHCQLGPVVMCSKAAAAGLRTSLFERFVLLGVRPIRLQVQYRMHPCLSQFPSNTFYEGSLQNGVTAQQRTRRDLEFPWVNPDKPMMFWSCNGSEEMAGTGTSYLNRSEAANCERVVTMLLRLGVGPLQIGVVTPYEGQRVQIVQQLSRQGPLQQQLYKDVEVSSVDAFQGREKDFIILSCVRSNEKQGIGFLNDPRRLNVALTRAKYGLVVLGNPRVLARRPLWHGLVTNFQSQGLLVEGPLTNLQVVNMRFPNVGRFRPDRRRRELDNAASSSTVFSGDIRQPYAGAATAGMAAMNLGVGSGGVGGGGSIGNGSISNGSIGGNEIATTPTFAGSKYLIEEDDDDASVFDPRGWRE